MSRKNIIKDKRTHVADKIIQGILLDILNHLKKIPISSDLNYRHSFEIKNNTFTFDFVLGIDYLNIILKFEDDYSTLICDSTLMHNQQICMKFWKRYDMVMFEQDKLKLSLESNISQEIWVIVKNSMTKIVDIT